MSNGVETSSGPDVQSTGDQAKRTSYAGRHRSFARSAGVSYDLRLGDCVDLLADIEAGTVDAILTDPPYCSGATTEAGKQAAPGQGLRSEKLRRKGTWFVGDNMTTAGLLWLMRAVAVESLRILKPSGSFLFCCDWRQSVNLVPAVESVGFRYQNLIVWNKGSMGLGTGFRAQHELILHFTAGRPEYHDRSSGNVLTHRRPSAKGRRHPTEKPVELFAELARVTSPEGGLVVDPFMGSGSTGAAVLPLGRSFIGIERLPEYFEIAAERLDDILTNSTADLYQAASNTF